GHQVVPCDFIGHSRTLGGSARDHDALIANMIAQSQALAFGVTAEEVGGDASLRRHRVTPGNRPSTTLFIAQLTAGAVGALVALYEHSTFVQGAMWGLNSFDQWGVELGKRLAGDVAAALGAASTANATHDNPTTQHDASTTQLVAMHRRWRDV
ncbi:MAG: glucose-6-phosphate isomerase, partial [Actinobacteria bacterium]|nr:glucose-6-phosphate isomerase [Actinomycetota bacterium]